jgi:hypothetical protein
MTSEAVIRRRCRGAALAAASLSLLLVAPGRLLAQEQPAPVAPASGGPASADPRVGLKPGFHNAGEAILNLEKIASLPKPQGFFDPRMPKGEPTPPERPRPASGSAPATPAAGGSASGPAAAAEEDETPEPGAAGNQPGAPAGRRAGAPPQRGGALNFANSDLAFSRDHLFVGNFHGFNTYDLAKADKLKLVASIVCPGGQGDVSVHGNLLVMSVEQTRGRLDCGTGGVQDRVSSERFRGVRIFDITDLKKPKQVAAVQTCRGSHTHTLVSSPSDKENLYVYGSGTGAVRAAEELAECSGKDPKEDPNTALFSIDVIKVPLAAPEKAAVVNRPRIFADPTTGNIAGLWKGGNHGPGTQTSRLTNQCHDITVFPDVGLAAGACSGNGILMDISDPVRPVRLDHVVDRNFAYWHSATFNNDGSKVIFTDEWGGGTRPRCRATDLPTWGANAIFDVVDRKLKFAGYYKLPVPQTDQENCVAHNGSLIPVPGRDIMVQAWYQGGISVFDFTDAAHPIEIAYFDRGPLDEKQLITGGFWSAYWYNGRIYGAEIARGIDVFKLTPSQFLSKNEIDAATLVHATEFNAQQQPKVAWPATSVVARAYLDQLTRANAIAAERASSVKSTLDRLDGGASAKGSPGAAAIAVEIDKLVADLQSDAGAAWPTRRTSLRSIATV